MKLKRLSLLQKVIIAIILGIIAGMVSPDWVTRIFVTINGLFSNFLGFIIPLLILGLVAPGISDLGRTAGKLLLITTLIAYGFTLFSGFFTYFSCEMVYPLLLNGTENIPIDSTIESKNLSPYFVIDIPPLMNVMTALIAAFTIGLGMSVIKGDKIKGVMDEFREIIMRVIDSVIIPILPIFIFGIFLNMTTSGQASSIMEVFFKIIILIFILTVTLLLIQFTIAGVVSRRNPIKLLKNMIPAYMTALGTQSSAATIPVTLAQTIKNGVNPDLAGFVVPLCATIHLSGSTMKIVACSLAIMTIGETPFNLAMYSGFIMMLGVTMIAAPGVPGGAIMAAIGVLQTILGFNDAAIGLMIALYIAMDSFGTACNVTGDGAIASIINAITKTVTTSEPQEKEC